MRDIGTDELEYINGGDADCALAIVLATASGASLLMSGGATVFMLSAFGLGGGTYALGTACTNVPQCGTIDNGSQCVMVPM